MSAADSRALPAEISAATSSMWTVMVLEGVLCRRDQPLPAAALNPVGAMVYRAISTIAPMILLCDALDARVVDHWLRQNNFKQHIRTVLGIRDLPPGLPVRMRQIDRLRSNNVPIRLAVDCDPVITEHLTATGIPALYLTEPEATAGVSPARQFARSWNDMSGAAPSVDDDA